MAFDEKQYREWMRNKQFTIRDSEMYLAQRYGDILTYNEVLELHNLAVRETLIIHNVEVITDMPWGIGLTAARDKWIAMMISARNIRMKENKNESLSN